MSQRAKKLRYRLTKAQNDALTLGPGVLVECTDVGAIVLHDGATLGGHVIGGSGVTVNWSNVFGAPATYPPAGHAAAHKHGGADEVATATPAANAIPKAGADGRLAAAWLPEVQQIPATDPPPETQPPEGSALVFYREGSLWIRRDDGSESRLIGGNEAFRYFNFEHWLAGFPV